MLAPYARTIAMKTFRQFAAALLLAVPEVNVNLESMALVYRLAYDDAYQLRPYALARWSAPPGQLLAQRLRTVLSRDRAVLDETASAALAQRSRSVPLVLRVRLEEFNHRFDSASDSKGVLRLRGTLLENTPAGERFVAQRSFDIEQPAPSADAAGGVRALTALSQTTVPWCSFILRKAFGVAAASHQLNAAAEGISLNARSAGRMLDIRVATRPAARPEATRSSTPAASAISWTSCGRATTSASRRTAPEARMSHSAHRARMDFDQQKDSMSM